MNEKKEIKISLTTFIVGIIAIVLLILVIVMGMYVATGNNREQTKTEVPNIGNVENVANKVQENSEKIEELDANSELVQELYSYIDNYLSGWFTGSVIDYEEIMHCNGKSTIDTISDDMKLLTVIGRMTESGEYTIIKKETLPSLVYKDGSKSEDVYKYRVRDYSYWYNHDTNDWEYKMFMNYEGDNTINVLDDVMAFDMKSIQKMSKQIFNEELKMEKHSYETDGFTLVYNESGYEWIPGGGTGTLNDTVHNVIKAEKINNNIYIYENYIAALENTETTSPVLYTALDKKRNIKPTKELDSIWDLTIEGKNGEYVLDTKKAKEEYGITLPIYKHTFKQAENGNYYWVSTELTNY